MKTSQEAINFIKGFESLHDGNPKTSLVEPMLDPVGIPTVGWGCTRYANGTRVKMGDPALTMQQCEDLFVVSLADAEAVVNKHVAVPLEQHQFDALVSFVFNVGPGLKGVKDGFVVLRNGEQSTMLKKLNEKCFSCAANEFSKWNMSQGKVLNGLTRRRFAERAMFLAGTY